MCVYVWAARIKHKAVRGRSRLDKLTFGTLNVCVVYTATVNGVNGIGHIDTPLRLCSARGYDVIGLQKPNRTELSKIVASGYRVYFSGHCSGFKGMKRQQGVRPAVKEDII